MTELEQWLSKSFRRQGPDLAIGPIRHALLLCREDVDVLIAGLIAGLIEARDILPTLDQRLAGLSTCEACDGTGSLYNIEKSFECDCQACDGSGFAPREGEDF